MKLKRQMGWRVRIQPPILGQTLRCYNADARSESDSAGVPVLVRFGYLISAHIWEAVLYPPDGGIATPHDLNNKRN